jgi:pSer/pThr/pTyr-binding forkhead associated (FHA) protein
MEQINLDAKTKGMLMYEGNGKLILLNPNGPEHEYELTKSIISLGRATTNDIILNDGRVSRNHARLEFGSTGATILDLSSSNGTRVNGIHIEHTRLQPGDTISLGSQQLKFLLDDPTDDPEITKIDTQAQLDQTINDEILPFVIRETTRPGLVAYNGEKTWRVSLDEQDRVIIGRDENCALFIDAPNVSRHHADVRKKGNSFILKDLGSTNGTFVGGNKIQQHMLQDGEVFRIGPAQINFKAGFQEQTLTMANDLLEKSTNRRTVIFVPGLMGSELWLGNERVWPNVKTMFTNPELFKYPSEVPLEPRSIVDELVIVPNLIKQDQYNRLGDYLVEELNYKRGIDFFEFPYDWRQDVRISARQLGTLIEGISSTQPLIIIAHSLGTMVSRYYMEKLGGIKRIERVILMGGPHKGAVKGLSSMLVAPEILPFGIMGERLRKILFTFPSSYQILPNYPAGTNQHGKKINFLKNNKWVGGKYLPLLQIGREFRAELATSVKYPSVAIFGYGIKTISDVSIVQDENGEIKNVVYRSDTTGDGSVLERSAFLPGAEIHPVHQHHGSLFVDNDVKMRLKIELTRTF